MPAPPDHPFGNGAVAGLEDPVDDLHLRHEALRIHREIRLAAILVNGKVARNAGALRKRLAGAQ